MIKPSKIHGRGLFPTKPISRFDPIVLKESPLAYTSLPGYCSYSLHPAKKRCTQCKRHSFLNRTAQIRAYRECPGLREECAYLTKTLGSISQLVSLTFRFICNNNNTLPVLSETKLRVVSDEEILQLRELLQSLPPGQLQHSWTTAECEMILNQVKISAFEICDAEQRSAGLGLFPTLSAVNNDIAQPSAIWLFDLAEDHPPQVSLVASRDIPDDNHEICISYVSRNDPLEKIYHRLQQDYGIPSPRNSFLGEQSIVMENCTILLVPSLRWPLDGENNNEGQIEKNKAEISGGFLVFLDNHQAMYQQTKESLDILVPIVRGKQLLSKARLALEQGKVTQAKIWAEETLQYFGNVLGPSHVERIEAISIICQCGIANQVWTEAVRAQRLLVARLRKNILLPKFIELDFALHIAVLLKLEKLEGQVTIDVVDYEVTKIVLNKLFGEPHWYCGWGGKNLLLDLFG